MASHHHCCRPHTCCCHQSPPPPRQTHLYSSCHNRSTVDLYHQLELELEPEPQSYYPPPPPPRIHHSHQQFFQLRRKPMPEEIHPEISSLIRRISALESSLLRHRLSSSPAWSLRDIAAVKIQTHFRAFLARRSRTLSQLKELAAIKSALHSLKATTSGNEIDPRLVSRKAMALLQKLESIQGGDPMIRDGKRSINRELIRFMDLIDRVCHKRSTQRRGNSSRVFSLVDVGALPDDDRGLRGRPSGGVADKTRRFVAVEEDGFDIVDSHGRNLGLLKRAGVGEGKVKKTVTFADDGKLYRTRHREEEDEEEDDDDEIEVRDNLGMKLEVSHDEDGAEAEEEDDDNYYVGDSLFSAPLPLKMDGRADLMKKTKRDAGH